LQWCEWCQNRWVDWFRVDSLAASYYHRGGTLSDPEPYRFPVISGYSRIPWWKWPRLSSACLHRGYPKDGNSNRQSDVGKLNG
jgi:hypothetical protein